MKQSERLGTEIQSERLGTEMMIRCTMLGLTITHPAFAAAVERQARRMRAGVDTALEVLPIIRGDMYEI